MYWDCKPQDPMPADAAKMTAATPGFPQGPMHCTKCFMAGDKMGCADCEDGFYVDKTGMCVKKEEEKHEHVELQTNIIPCPAHMDGGCKVCAEGELEFAGEKHMV